MDLGTWRPVLEKSVAALKLEVQRISKQWDHEVFDKTSHRPGLMGSSTLASAPPQFGPAVDAQTAYGRGVTSSSRDHGPGVVTTWTHNPIKGTCPPPLSDFNSHQPAVHPIPSPVRSPPPRSPPPPHPFPHFYPPPLPSPSHHPPPLPSPSRHPPPLPSPVRHPPPLPSSAVRLRSLFLVLHQLSFHLALFLFLLPQIIFILTLPILRAHVTTLVVCLKSHFLNSTVRTHASGARAV